MPRGIRGTRADRNLRDQVVREEPVCWLQYTGCTGRSTTADHVIPFEERPDLAMIRPTSAAHAHHATRKRGSSGSGPATEVTIINL